MEVLEAVFALQSRTLVVAAAEVEDTYLNRSWEEAAVAGVVVRHRSRAFYPVAVVEAELVVVAAVESGRLMRLD